MKGWLRLAFSLYLLVHSAAAEREQGLEDEGRPASGSTSLHDYGEDMSTSKRLSRSYLARNESSSRNLSPKKAMIMRRTTLLSDILERFRNSPAPPPITVETSMADFTPIRINCGGYGFTDEEGNDWQKDVFYNGGLTFRSRLSRIQGLTDLAGLTQYQTWRYGLSLFGDPLVYNIPVPDGLFNVTLHFTELIYGSSGRRRFNVWMEDSLAIEAIDIVARTGGRYKVTSISRMQQVSDGSLTIRFISDLGSPVVSAISVVAAPTDAPTDSPTTSTPITAPSVSPSSGPTSSPTGAPSAMPSAAPTMAPSSGPTSSPTGFPTVTPSAAPTLAPSSAPTSSPTGTPTVTPSAAPTLAPSSAPTSAPTGAPTVTPSAVPSAAPTAFESLFINCGGDTYTDFEGRTWIADQYYEGGQVHSKTIDISNTQYDILFQSERNGDFQYEIPLPAGDYEIVLHLAEIEFALAGERIFDMTVEENEFKKVDIVALGAGASLKAVALAVASLVDDGALSIKVFPIVNVPKLSAIEIKKNLPHLAHAVPNGPYAAVDTNDSGTALVDVDGGPSHTHGLGLKLISWTWKEGFNIIGEGEVASLLLTVGEHIVSLTVEDDGGNEHTDTTTITVLPFGYPFVSSLQPMSGSINGGEVVTISGSGFTYSKELTVVHFGLQELSGNDIEILNDSTIKVTSPASNVAAPVSVTVKTPLGESTIGPMYTYVADVPIDFVSNKLAGIDHPSAVAFGPDGKLYVATNNGKLAKLTLDATFQNVEESVTATVAEGRIILGIAFDPIDTSLNPTVYFSHSKIFHGTAGVSSSGSAINGKISTCSGANLDIVEDLITGLPVSEHDHCVNGLAFGDNGELYIQVGGNTNGGVFGPLSDSKKQKENVLSAATLVAYLANPDFDGTLTYDAPDDGNLSGGKGVEVFACGERNPVGIVLHSNGYLYGTDNGPNKGYGKMSIGCNGEEIDDVYQWDRLNLLVKDGYYGHPNRKRGEDDPRQCVWRSNKEPSDDEYTAPLMELKSSSNGIIEFESDHFYGALRSNLIVSKFKDELYRIILAPDGKSVVPQSIPAIKLVGDDTFVLAQAPDGTIVDGRYDKNALYYHKPSEPTSTLLAIKTCFPRRGSVAGGSTLSVWGVNFGSGVIPWVTVGGSDCPIISVSSTKIECTLPGGSGTVDVVVSNGSWTSIYKKGYRYITGLPA